MTRPAALPPTRAMSARVGRVLALATPAERTAGARWYDEAHELAHELAELHDLDDRQAAGILAALSPCTSWTRNVHLAHLLAGTGDAPHRSGLCILRARMIRAGAEPLDVLGGAKVRAFFALVADPADPSTVCVDRHAVDVVAGRRSADTDPVRRIVERPSGYTPIADAYRRAAARHGMARAHEAQAVAWLAWRRLHGIAA